MDGLVVDEDDIDGAEMVYMWPICMTLIATVVCSQLCWPDIIMITAIKWLSPDSLSILYEYYFISHIAFIYIEWIYGFKK